MDLGINFDFFLIFKIDTQIHIQKIIFFILNYLFRNLQEIRKILKLKLKTRILKKTKRKRGGGNSRQCEVPYQFISIHFNLN
jgi:hypothetical protein